MNNKTKIPPLPRLLKSKIYKTGQTRGADDDVIFQNRVNRNGTVLIPYSYFEVCQNTAPHNGIFENGYIVLINPEEYFGSNAFLQEMENKGIKLGINALLFYYSRLQWTQFNPIEKGLKPANSRKDDLGGEYVARVSATTAANDMKIQHGFTSNTLKGAGIRVYEYASSEQIRLCQLQLEYLFWKCYDSQLVAQAEGMTDNDIAIRRKYIENEVNNLSLNDTQKLISARILNQDINTVCPLCLEEISATGFFTKVQQAEGREVTDLTVTQLNLFHIQELRMGEFNHRIYNLGWGHHHCNIIVKDSGINATLIWMKTVIDRNYLQGFDFKRKE